MTMKKQNLFHYKIWDPRPGTIENKTKISIDFVGPKEFTETGNRYILTIQDSFSKFCLFVPTR